MRLTENELMKVAKELATKIENLFTETQATLLEGARLGFVVSYNVPGHRPRVQVAVGNGEAILFGLLSQQVLMEDRSKATELEKGE